MENMKRKEIVAFRVSKNELQLLRERAKEDSDLSSYLRKLALEQKQNESGDYHEWERITPKRRRSTNTPELAQVTQMAPTELAYGRFF